MNTIEQFAELLEKDQTERLKAQGLDCQRNIDNAKTIIKRGKLYTKVDVGNSGKYMIDNRTNEIFGIKAYGVINKKKKYGTLETINEWYWGDYTAYKKYF